MNAAECLDKAIDKQINGNKAKSWTQGDSAECILALVVNETGVEASDLEDIAPIIRLLCNPSQTLQQLVKMGKLDAREKGTRGASVSIANFIAPAKAKSETKVEVPKTETPKTPATPTGKPAK